MIPMWHQMGHVVMIAWTIFENRLLEVGQTQNRETMALPNFTTVLLELIIVCEDSA